MNLTPPEALKRYSVNGNDNQPPYRAREMYAVHLLLEFSVVLLREERFFEQFGKRHHLQITCDKTAGD